METIMTINAAEDIFFRHPEKGTLEVKMGEKVSQPGNNVYFYIMGHCGSYGAELRCTTERKHQVLKALQAFQVTDHNTRGITRAKLRGLGFTYF